MGENGLDWFDLTGQVALVTGSSRGLGRAMALALAEAGCDVAVNARKEEALIEVIQAIRQMGRKVIGVPGDVGDESDVQRMVEQVAQSFGRLDILVNNAGIWEGGYLIRLKAEEWERVIRTNLTGVFLMTREVAKVMLKQRRGKIINVASILGFRGTPQSAAYAATKAGVIQMTRVAAIELGPKGIRVNAIAPGFFDTDMTRRYQAEPEALAAHVARIPLRRYGQPEDLSGVVVFLASKASDHITGQTLVVDGGESLV
jgi:3-oxoacyl-[acyl-carrier protein] reductase